MKTTNISHRNKGIDIIRGLCIIAVILLHLNIHFSFSQTFLKELLPKKLFSFLFWNGYYGVVIFFTLSGYLITNSILKKWGRLSNIDFKTFYWFRFARIVPLLTLTLLILSVLHLLNVQGFVINPEKTSLTRAIFSVLSFHFNWLEIQVGYLPANWDVLWSISIEESFYLIFPLACFFLRKNWSLITLLISFLLVSPWARTNLFIGNDLGDKNNFAYLDAIALGCMAAVVISKVHLSKHTRRFFLLTGLVMVLLVLYFKGFVYKFGITSLGLNITVLSIGIVFILFWLHQKTNFKEVLFLKWLSSFGKYSYEIYLTHMFVIILGAKVFKSLSLTEDWLIGFSLLLIAIAFILGKVIFNYFSEPINTWLRQKWLLKNPLKNIKN